MGTVGRVSWNVLPKMPDVVKKARSFQPGIIIHEVACVEKMTSFISSKNCDYCGRERSSNDELSSCLGCGSS